MLRRTCAPSVARSVPDRIRESAARIGTWMLERADPFRVVDSVAQLHRPSHARPGRHLILPKRRDASKGARASADVCG